MSEPIAQKAGLIGFHPDGQPVPEVLRTSRLHLRPLRASDVALDYDAVMSSAATLRQWSQTDWPADDFTLAQNLADLERHEREHQDGVAFTYTVLDPPGTRCLGCVYIQPLRPEAHAAADGFAHVASVTFWVRDSERSLGLDAHLLAALGDWFRTTWAFDRIVFSVAKGHETQAALLAASGLKRLLACTWQDGREVLVFG